MLGRTVWVGLGAALLTLAACDQAEDSRGQAPIGCTAGMACTCPDGSSQVASCDATGAPSCPCPGSMAGAGGGGSGGAGGVGATGGVGGAAGMMIGGSGGMTGGAGGAGSGGAGAMGGTSAGMTGGLGGMAGGTSGGMGGTMMSGGDGGDGGDPAQGETGAMVGMTAAHNAKRAMVDAAPPLEDLVWDEDIAAFAQGYADQLAANCSSQLMHNDSDYGENLAAFFSFGSGMAADPQRVVNGWYNEVDCWTYGTINGTEQCNQACVSAMNSNGCGHYTQVVWRQTERIGCGVSSCNDGGSTIEYWVCNYDPPGNWVGMTPY